MITDEKKNRIESLTEEEMKAEIDLGDKSRFQKEKFSYLKEHYRQRRVVRADGASKSYIKMTVYLARNNKPYQGVMRSLLVLTTVAVIGLLQFDFSNLLESQMVNKETKDLIINTGPYIIIGLFVLSFLALNRYFMRKYKDPSKLSDEELDKLLKYL